MNLLGDYLKKLAGVDELVGTCRFMLAFKGFYGN